MEPESSEQQSWRKEFETSDESQVRLLAEPDPSRTEPLPKSLFAKVWLDECASAKRDRREEETLSIAKNALSISSEANRIASDDLAIAAASSAAAAKQAECAEEQARAAAEQARWAKWAAVIATVAAIIAISAK